MLRPRGGHALLFITVHFHGCTEGTSTSLGSANTLTAGCVAAAGCTATAGDTSTSEGTSTNGGTSTNEPTSTGSATVNTATGSGSETSPDTTSGTSSGGISSTDTSPLTSGMSTEGGSDSTGEAFCPEAEIICDGQIAKICDGKGGFNEEQICPNACVPGVGCKLCTPGSTTCDGETVLKCDSEGDSLLQIETCDSIQGVVCDPDQGMCKGACAPVSLGLSYIGCDYYPTVTLQSDTQNTSPTHNFGIAVANTSPAKIKVTITQGAQVIAETTVAANSVGLVQLPWVDVLTKGTGPSTLVKSGAYRVRTDGPVTVYQYNSLAAASSNDASLLLPVNTWTGDYLIASWPRWLGFPGMYAVTASQDNTQVTLSPSNTGKLVQAGGGVGADGSGVVMLNRGDVLQVVSQTVGNADLTGTRVNANRPVQVIGGHKCTNVPLDVAACDHLEESMFPVETLAKEYLVAPPAQVPMDLADKAQVVRIIASEGATTLEFSPDQPVSKFLVNAGDFIEVPATVSRFRVKADKKILVSQYMVGQFGGYGTGDPSMVLAVNPQQWRSKYLFHAPTSWTANYVDVLATAGAEVMLDDAPVGGWQPVGNTGYAVAHVKLSNAGDGNHTLTSNAGVGIAVTGVKNAGSYWYPGGLDLNVIPQ